MHHPPSTRQLATHPWFLAERDRSQGVPAAPTTRKDLGSLGAALLTAKAGFPHPTTSINELTARS